MPRLAPSKNLFLLGGVLALGIAARYYGDRTYTSAVNFHFRMPRDMTDVETWIAICVSALAGSFFGAALGYRLNRATSAIMGSVGAAVATAQYSSIVGGVLGAPIGLLVAWLGPRRMAVAMLACLLATIAGVGGGVAVGAISLGPVEPVPLLVTMLSVVSTVAAVNVFVAKRFPGGPEVKLWRRVAGRLVLATTTLAAAIVSIPLGITFESLACVRGIGRVAFCVELRSLGTACFTRGFCNDAAWEQTSVFDQRILRKLRRFDGITMFHLNRADIGDESMKLFGEWPGLWYLDLSETRVSDKGMCELAGLRTVGSLNLSGTSVTGEYLSELPPALQELQLAGTAVTDASLTQLTALPLRRLVLKDTAIGDAGVVNLRGVRGLKGLDLSGTRITDAALATLAKNHAWLSHLELRGTGITRAGLAHLATLPRLSLLDLRNCGITDEAVDELVRCRSLFSLKLEGTKITPERVVRLREALPDCNVDCE